MVDKQKAIKLRENGCTYTQISEQLGCSVDWCKRNLKGVKKNTTEIDILSECMTLALSNTGITNNEIQYIITKHIPTLTEYKDIEPVYKRIKRKIQQNKQAIIRPVWMNYKTPQTSFSSVLLSVNALNERIDDEINNIRRELQLGEEYTKPLKFAVFSLSQIGELFTGRPVDSVLSYLHDTIDKLQSANPSHEHDDYISGSVLYNGSDSIPDGLPDSFYFE